MMKMPSVGVTGYWCWGISPSFEGVRGILSTVWAPANQLNAYSRKQTAQKTVVVWVINCPLCSLV